MWVLCICKCINGISTRIYTLCGTHNKSHASNIIIVNNHHDICIIYTYIRMELYTIAMCRGTKTENVFMGHWCASRTVSSAHIFISIDCCLLNHLTIRWYICKHTERTRSLFIIFLLLHQQGASGFPFLFQHRRTISPICLHVRVCMCVYNILLYHILAGLYADRDSERCMHAVHAV